MNRPSTVPTPTQAWHNRPELKDEVMARLRAHRAEDSIVQGLYQQYAPELASRYRGCALGCTLPLYPTEERPSNRDSEYWWSRIEIEYGIPIDIAALIDNLFEEQYVEDAGDFAVTVIDAIPVGADLTNVVDAYDEDQMYDAEPRAAARWLIQHLAAAPIPQAVA